MSICNEHNLTREPPPVFPVGTEVVALDEDTFAPCCLLNGWVGLQGPGVQEPRIFGVLLPGDALTHIAGHGRCAAVGLTPTRFATPQSTVFEGVPHYIIRQVFRLSQMNALERTADFLLETGQRLRGTVYCPEWTYSQPLTQNQMGEMLGLSSVHMNRTLRRLSDMALIRYVPGKVAILDPEALAKLAGSVIEAVPERDPRISFH